MAAKVTIGMPVYNGATWLPQSMAALSAQSFADVAIIVSDDGSTDGSLDLVRDWAARDPRVEVHRQPRNLGTIAHFEWLVEKADSPYFMWAAQDDDWSPDYVEILLAALEADPGLALAVPQLVHMADDWSHERKRVPFEPPRAPSGHVRVRQLLRMARSGWFYGLFRRARLLPVMPDVRAYGHAWGHDFVTLLPILLAGDVCGDSRAVFYQRISQRSEVRLKPGDSVKQLRMYLDFVRVALGQSACHGRALERAFLAPAVISYAGRHSVKLRRIIAGASGLRTR